MQIAGCPAEDAVLEVPGSKGNACGTSTAVGTVMLEAVIAAAIERLIQLEVTPTLFISASLDGTDQHNRALTAAA